MFHPQGPPGGPPPGLNPQIMQMLRQRMMQGGGGSLHREPQPQQFAGERRRLSDDQ